MLLVYSAHLVDILLRHVMSASLGHIPSGPVNRIQKYVNILCSKLEAKLSLRKEWNVRLRYFSQLKWECLANLLACSSPEKARLSKELGRAVLDTCVDAFDGAVPEVVCPLLHCLQIAIPAALIERSDTGEVSIDIDQVRMQSRMCSY